MMNQLVSPEAKITSSEKLAGTQIRLPPGVLHVLVRLAPAVNGAIRCTWTEIPCLLQAVEVIQNWLGHGCPVRSGDVFNEYNLSGLVLRNAPEPGVRNDGSNHPGKTLAPIQVARDEL